MKRILDWLIVKLSGTGVTGATEERRVSKKYYPAEPAASSDLQANNDDLMPDIYDQTTGDDQVDDDTQPDLEIIETPASTSELSEGFDPYNTGSSNTKK